MPDDIVVIGAGGFGRETLDVIEAINESSVVPRWNVIGVVDDGPAAVQLARLADRGYLHLGTLDDARTILGLAGYVVAIGSPSVRRRLVAMLDGWGSAAAALVHPSAVVGSQVALGDGSIVCGGVQLSTNVRVGEHVHVNPGAIIGHDSILEGFVSVNPGAIVSGEVRVKSRTLVGAGAVVLQGLTIGENATIGASACVTREVPSNAMVKGIPAR